VSPSVTDLLAGGRIRPILTLTLLVAAVFWPAAGFDFVRWDDPVNVTQNPLITEPWSGALLQKIVNGDTALRFKPLPWLIYRGVHAAFGFNPAAWHVLGLGLHLGATLVFWLVLRSLLARFQAGAPAGTRDLLAWVGAAVWAVHPAHVEPACWVTATPYPLMIIFLLGSFWFYCRGMDPAGTRRNLVIAWIISLLAYATYPVGVTYGLWLMAADVWIFRAAPRRGCSAAEAGRWLARHALFLAPAAASAWITWKSAATTPWLYPAPPSLTEVDLWLRLKMGAAMLGSVWTHFFWPVGMTPNNPMLPPAIANGRMIFLMAAGTILGLLVVWLLRKRTPATLGVVLGSTLLALPVLGFGQWPSWAVADRHVYLPHLVLTGAGVLMAARWWRVVERPAALLAAMVLVVGLAAMGRQQVMIWRDTDTLFAYIEKQPAFTWNASQQAYIYQLWAAQAQETGRAETARDKNQQARQALQRGMIAAAEREAWSEAVDYAGQLEQSFGLPPQLRRERARWLLSLNRLAEAGADLRQAAREMPADAELESLAAEWRKRTGQPPKDNHL
jgi:hypothetical protein